MRLFVKHWGYKIGQNMGGFEPWKFYFSLELTLLRSPIELPQGTLSFSVQKHNFFSSKYDSRKHAYAYMPS